MAAVGQTTVDDVAVALATYNLVVRGGFNFSSDEDAPLGSSGVPARAVLLIGNAGGGFWPGFRNWQTGRPSSQSDPLDNWCREVIERVAGEMGAQAVSPSDRPYLPFQQWAMRAEGLKPSPLGILMHPDYGLWHAYRGALLFDNEIPIQQARGVSHLCDLCVGKPCLKACPVDAHSLSGFAYQACLAHVRGSSEQACRNHGCFDRNACPYGANYRYPVDMQVFIMKAFAGL